MFPEAICRTTCVFGYLGVFSFGPTTVFNDLCVQELTPDADIVNVRFTKSVIASKAAFTYEEAQIRKDDL